MNESAFLLWVNTVTSLTVLTITSLYLAWMITGIYLLLNRTCTATRVRVRFVVLGAKVAWIVASWLLRRPHILLGIPSKSLPRPTMNALMDVTQSLRACHYVQASERPLCKLLERR